MTIGEIIDRLNKREPLAIIAKRLEISPYTLSKKLRVLGYEYDGEQKKRIFIGEGEEPRHLYFQEATALQSVKTDYQVLIYEQLQSIYELLRKREERIIVTKNFKNSEKKKRTFSICTEILEGLDVVAGTTGIQKSKIVEEALKEFLQRYKEVDELEQNEREK
ncbi:ribbon-helix-helix domain-containing protein [Bacillus gaemokensis]|uniref:CopG family transcriptional regulator n=1 Tax=Bacillus gaemokensis TaxID=574375 RepID=A0A073KUI6_9BACI|nr:ribbon-helix-helix domain-containing protein [Bacillus gaemokensis]KEK26038.1 CopG family transcriptional regulator [Bacillus gaemokensis]KYG38850.1 CopG family transcriptional regulator [Bacillus gaemokensis]